MSALSLLPPTARIRAYAGDDSTFTLRFHREGVAQDVSGSHLAQIRSSPESATVLGTWEIDATLAVEGSLVLTLRANVAAVLPLNTLMAWDLEWLSVDDVKRTLVKGSLQVDADVSR